MERSIQKSKLTEEQIKLFRTIANGAEPYPLDEPKLLDFDNHLNDKRVAATRARQILLEHGIKLDE